MHQASVIIVRILPPALGIVAGLLGFATLEQNLLGWFVFAAGVLYAAGSIISSYVLGRDVQGARTAGGPARAWGWEFSSWLFTGAMVAVLCLSPLEFLCLRMQNVPARWLELAGTALTSLGGLVFLWALFSRARSNAGEPLRRPGPYRVIRYPEYAGYLLAGIGLVIGYASAWGAAALLLALAPAILWRIRSEDRRRLAERGEQFQTYATRTKRLIPGVW